MGGARWDGDGPWIVVFKRSIHRDSPNASGELSQLSSATASCMGIVEVLFQSARGPGPLLCMVNENPSVSARKNVNDRLIISISCRVV